MKVLWISHDPIRNEYDNIKSYSGFWKEELLLLLKQDSNFEIFIAYPGNKYDNIDKYHFTFIFKKRQQYCRLPNITKKQIIRIVNTIKPDIIHIHGTEKSYGLIYEDVNVPIVISIQGFISECSKFVLGNIDDYEWKKVKTIKEVILRNSTLDIYKYMSKYKSIELEIIKNCRYFFGRTKFDKSIVKSINSDSVYFEGNEVLRNDFYINDWNINNIERHSIYTSSFSNPLKGFHILLKSVEILKKKYKDIRVYVPGNITQQSLSFIFGNSYNRMISKYIERYDIKDNIIFLGNCSSKIVAKYLLCSNVFVLTSYIENSSNALGEALCIGTPSVVPDKAGGTDTIVEDRINSIKFANGDYIDLASKISMIFDNDDLAVCISKKSKARRYDFYDKNIIAKQYTLAYRRIIDYESTI